MRGDDEAEEEEEGRSPSPGTKHRYAHAVRRKRPQSRSRVLPRQTMRIFFVYYYIRMNSMQTPLTQASRLANMLARF
jgi:hypothetical protein